MIKVWDYVKEYELLRDEILKAVDDVFKGGILIFGEFSLYLAQFPVFRLKISPELEISPKIKIPPEISRRGGLYSRTRF